MTPYAIVRHPAVLDDFGRILDMLTDLIGRHQAVMKVNEVRREIKALASTPHIGTLRNDVVIGLRAIPVGANAVVAFAVFEDTREVMIYAVTWGGADWMGRSRRRVRG